MQAKLVSQIEWLTVAKSLSSLNSLSLSDGTFKVTPEISESSIWGDESISSSICTKVGVPGGVGLTAESEDSQWGAGGLDDLKFVVNETLPRSLQNLTCFYRNFSPLWLSYDV